MDGNQGLFQDGGPGESVGCLAAPTPDPPPVICICSPLNFAVSCLPSLEQDPEIDPVNIYPSVTVNSSGIHVHTCILIKLIA